VPRAAGKKKPRGRALTPGEKRHNRALSRIRLRVEHALSGVKRCRIVKDTLRNTAAHFSDRVIVIACGLHNLRRQHPHRRRTIARKRYFR
jgi:hypothetical protein